MYCVELSQDLQSKCQYEPTRLVQDLNPYDHLQIFFHLCVTHFKRNIQSISQHLSHSVVSAMYSLASAEPQLNMDETPQIIQKEGPKAKGRTF